MLPNLLTKIAQKESDELLRPWVEKGLQIVGDDPRRILQDAVEVWMQRRLDDDPAQAEAVQRARALMALVWAAIGK